VKNLMPAIRFKLFMTLVLGLIYPLMMTGVSQVLFPLQASGDFQSRGGQLVGSHLISQKFESLKYFWSRPSAVDYNPLASGGSNLGLTSQDLKKAVDERRQKLKAAHADSAGEPPQDLLFASGSGLDPHISLDAAQYQLTRVAKVRFMSVEQVQKFIGEASEGRGWGILGEPTVNVLALNLALDQSQGIYSAPVLLPAPKSAENAGAPAASEAK